MTNERSITRHPSSFLVDPVSGAIRSRPVTAVGPPAPIRRPAPEVLRRRRLAVAMGVALLTVTGVGVASASVGRSGTEVATVHVVMPGESLWSIARDAKPRGDIRPLVSKLRRQLGGSTLQPGDEIVVPGP